MSPLEGEAEALRGQETHLRLYRLLLKYQEQQLEPEDPQKGLYQVNMKLALYLSTSELSALIQILKLRLQTG